MVYIYSLISDSIENKIQYQQQMGKKITNPKLKGQVIGKGESMLSVFNKFANQVTESRKKKIQKIGDVKQRLMQSKKSNKMLKVSKRTSKFALLEDEDGGIRGLTHRGKSINELKQFNDMNFGEEMEDDEFLKVHENLNFTGFDQEEEQKQRDVDRPKSKSQIYKEIIEKSKLHKHLRQEVYEQNFEKAVQLDNEFPEFARNLKFRNRDSNVREKIVNGDNDFQRMANMLKQDQRVVSNKVIEKTEKYTENMKRKKNEQLNALMKDSSDQEGDIRGWIRSVRDGNRDQEEQEEGDQIDDVQLSSGDEQQQDLQEGDQEDDQVDNLSGQEQDEQQNDDDDSGEVEQSQSQQSVKIVKTVANPKGQISRDKVKGKIEMKQNKKANRR